MDNRDRSEIISKSRRFAIFHSNYPKSDYFQLAIVNLISWDDIYYTGLIENCYRFLSKEPLIDIEPFDRTRIKDIIISNEAIAVAAGLIIQDTGIIISWDDLESIVYSTNKTLSDYYDKKTENRD